MLDELLGRAELKRRIEELEAERESLREERDRLEERLDAERRRRKEAARERQNAAERVNRLEDRIAGLEGKIERLESEEGEATVPDAQRLGIEATREVLDRLEGFAAPPDGALTASIVGDVPEEAREAFGERAGDLARAAPCVAVTDDRGLVSCALEPPLPPEPFVRWDAGFDLKRGWFLPQERFALALVRADLFAIGEYEGKERVSVEGFESDVMGDHSKGGFSQGRFERRRDEQIEAHLDRCREALADREADRLYLVGDRRAIDELDGEAEATAAVDATGDPEEALEDAFREFWTTRLYRL